MLLLHSSYGSATSFKDADYGLAIVKKSIDTYAIYCKIAKQLRIFPFKINGELVAYIDNKHNFPGSSVDLSNDKKSIAIKFNDKSVEIEALCDVSGHLSISRCAFMGAQQNNSSLFFYIQAPLLTFTMGTGVLGNCLLYGKEAITLGNDTALYVRGSCTLKTKNGPLALSSSSRLETSKKLTLSIPDNNIKLDAAQIIAQGNIVIRAHELSAQRKPITQKDGFWEGHCQEFVQHESSGPSIIMSRSGNIDIDVKAVVNEASIIFARKNINIRFTQLDNKAHYLITRLCERNDCLGIVKAVDRPLYSSAVIWAGNKLTINGISKNFDSISELHNTGFIGSGHIFSLGGKEGEFLCKNGISADALIPRYTKNRFENSITPISLWSNPLFADSAHEQNQANMVIHNPGKHDLTPAIKFFYTPVIEADLICQDIFERTGFPLVAGYKDCFVQYNDLKKNALFFALVNGTPVCRAVHNSISCKMTDTPTTVLSQRDDALVKSLIINYRKDNTLINPHKVMHSVTMKETSDYNWLVSPEVQHSTPTSFVYYTVTKDSKGDTVFLPSVFIALCDYRENFHPEGIMRSRYLQIAGPHMQIINTGSIIAVKKIIIKVKKIVNQSNSTIVYLLRTPQEKSGVIMGVDIEIVVDNDLLKTGDSTGIYNKGGTIKAKRQLKLYAKNGSIENSYVLSTSDIQLEQTQGFGKYIRGTIQSEEAAVDLSADAGSILNEASRIIGHNNVNLKAYLDIVTKTLAYQHDKKHSPRSSAMACEEDFGSSSFKKCIDMTEEDIVREAVVVDSEIRSKTANVNYTAGRVVQDTAGFTEAGGNITFNGKQGNTLKAASLPLTINCSGWSKNTDATWLSVIQPRYNATGHVIFKTDKDNTLESVLINSPHPALIDAGHNNYITVATKKEIRSGNALNAEINAVAITPIANILNEKFDLFFNSLLNADPLLANIVAAIKEKYAADKVAAVTYATVDILNLIDQYLQQYPKKANIITMLAQRYGLANTAGELAPQIAIRFGISWFNAEHHQSVPTIINTPRLYIKSGKDTEVAAAIFNVPDKVKYDVKGILKLSPHWATYSSSATDIGFIFLFSLFSLIGGGADAKHETMQAQVYKPMEFASDKTVLQVNELVNVTGAVFSGKCLDADIAGDLHLESLPDVTHAASYTGGITASSTGGSGFVGGRITDILQIPTQTAIKTKKIKAKVAGTLSLIAALVNSTGSLEARRLHTRDIPTYIKMSGLNLGISVNQGTAVPVVVDPSGTDYHLPGIVRSVIAPTVDLRIHEGSTYHETNPERAHENFAPRDTKWRVVIPFIDVWKLGKTFRDYANSGDDQAFKEYKLASEELRKKIKIEQQAPNAHDTGEHDKTDTDIDASQQQESSINPELSDFSDTSKQTHPDSEKSQARDDNHVETKVEKAISQALQRLSSKSVSKIKRDNKPAQETNKLNQPTSQQVLSTQNPETEIDSRKSPFDIKDLSTVEHKKSNLDHYITVGDCVIKLIKSAEGSDPYNIEISFKSGGRPGGPGGPAFWGGIYKILTGIGVVASGQAVTVITTGGAVPVAIETTIVGGTLIADGIRQVATSLGVNVNLLATPPDSSSDGQMPTSTLKQSALSGGEIPSPNEQQESVSSNANLQKSTTEEFKRILNNQKFNVNDLKKIIDAGNRFDKGLLTKAGRSAQKHGSRPSSVFLPTKGNPASINIQGSLELEKILNDIAKIKPNRFGGVDIHASDGRGVRIASDWSLMGFLEP